MSDGLGKKLLDQMIALKSKYENVFGSIDGKEVLEDILKSGYVFRTPFEPGHPDMTNVNIGKMELALHIKSMAEPRPEVKKEAAIT